MPIHYYLFIIPKSETLYSFSRQCRFLGSQNGLLHQHNQLYEKIKVLAHLEHQESTIRGTDKGAEKAKEFSKEEYVHFKVGTVILEIQVL